MRYTILLLLISVTLSCGGDTIPGKANVSITDQKYEKGDNYNFYYYRGKLKNNGGLDARLVTVKITHYDSEGFELASDFSYSNPSTLNKGEEGTFNIFIGELPNGYDESKTLVYIEWL